MRKKKLLALAMSALMALSIFSGCGNESGGGGEVKSEPTFGGELVIGLTGAPYSTANWLSNDLNTSLLMSAINPRLLSIKDDGTKEMIILKEATKSEDLKTYTWKIHEGLSWHDGVPFTVKDIGFSFDYQVKHKLGHGSTYYANVESWKAVDDYTLEIHLKKPQVNFTEQAGYWPVVMPEHIYKDVEDPKNFEYNGLGYGPFKIVESKEGEYYYCEKVENWPLANDGKGAYLDKITFRIYQDSNALTLALLNGEVDVTGSYVNMSSQSQIKGNPNFTVFNSPSLGYGFLGFNYNNEFLADNNVRKAIAMSLDREALVKTAKQGGALVMNTPISPVFTELNKSNITFPALDVEGAKKVLEDAGYKDTNGDGIREKDGKDLAFTLTCRSNTLNVDSCANILKSNMESIGVGITIEILESSTYVDKVTNNKVHEMNFIEWGTVDDPDMAQDIYHSTSHLNMYNYKNETIDELTTQLSAEPDPEKRKVLLDEFQREFVKELPCVDLFVTTYGWGASNAFAGWDYSPGYYGVIELKHLVNVYKIAE